MPPISKIETSVCIVGAGAAGITLARELAAHSIDVCVLESGGYDLDDNTQSLYEGEVIGLPYYPLNRNRQRRFGGTTNVWAGVCRPLDEIDFEERPWVPYSGWPVLRSELFPYYARAHQVCQLREFEYNTKFWEHSLNSPKLALSDKTVTRIYQVAPQARFGEIYGDELSKTPSIRVYLFANVTDIATNDTGSTVSYLQVSCLNGSRFKVTAKTYIIATGGIENARLLLNSDRVKREGLGNDNGLVGRFFMEHIHFPSGVIQLSTESKFPSPLYIKRHSPALARLFLSEHVQRDEELLNYNAMLRPTYPWIQKSLRGKIGSMLSIARRTARFPRDLGNLLGTLRVLHTVEQSPNPLSRITLGTDEDALGLRRVRLCWQTTVLEQHTVSRGREIIGEEFEAADLGMLTCESKADTSWPPLPLQGSRGHHMGTTRMSRNPRQGVVDENCRVHGIKNMFIAGSSVFPTGGAGTPTLTIIALALRLADYIVSGAQD